MEVGVGASGVDATCVLETGTGVSVGTACTAAEANGAKAAQVTRRTLERYILLAAYVYGLRIRTLTGVDMPRGRVVCTRETRLKYRC